VLRTFEVGGSGKWDYLTADPESRRLYVTQGSRVVVLDADRGTKLGEIAETAGAHGVALSPQGEVGFISNGADNTISVFDPKTLKTARRIKAGEKPDSIIYDPASRKILAFCGRSGEVAIVDPAALDQAPLMLPVGGKLETGVTDGAGRVYVNVEDKHEIVVIDSKQPKVIAHWPLGEGKRPTGLAIDVARHRLFSGCSNKKMIVLDANQGRVLATLPIGGGVDGVAFDPQLNLAMSADGDDGTLTAVREEPAGSFKVLQTLATAKSAKTITVDPKTHHVFLPCEIGKEKSGRFSVLVVGATSER
jgi:DNA-binding beta-propeller fold protein YncE